MRRFDIFIFLFGCFEVVNRLYYAFDFHRGRDKVDNFLHGLVRHRRLVNRGLISRRGVNSLHLILVFFNGK